MLLSLGRTLNDVFEQVHDAQRRQNHVYPANVISEGITALSIRFAEWGFLGGDDPAEWALDVAGNPLFDFISGYSDTACCLLRDCSLKLSQN